MTIHEQQCIVVNLGNPVSISSILLWFGTFDCGIAFLENLITKLPTKLIIFFFHFFFGIGMFHMPSCHFKNYQFPAMARGFSLMDQRWPLMEF